MVTVLPVEAKTYRYYGHFQGDAKTYRTKEEEEYYRSKDCLKQFEEKLTNQGLANADELAGIRAAVQREILEAVEYAANSPWPKPEDTYTNVYVRF
ncbi:MAG: thiamine pyrophosphate-dependent enzyme [Bacillota bacterium]